MEPAGIVLVVRAVPVGRSTRFETVANALVRAVVARPVPSVETIPVDGSYHCCRAVIVATVVTSVISTTVEPFRLEQVPYGAMKTEAVLLTDTSPLLSVLPPVATT